MSVIINHYVSTVSMVKLAFQGENILQVELDMPNRTTRDYEGPSVAPKIQAVLDAALEDEGDIDIDDRSAAKYIYCCESLLEQPVFKVTMSFLI